jgi:hypothetical protein
MGTAVEVEGGGLGLGGIVALDKNGRLHYHEEWV